MKTLSVIALVSSLTLTPVYGSELEQCESEAQACSELVEAQDEVIEKQDEVIERLNNDVTTLEIEAEERRQWYRHPAFTGALGILLGLVTGVTIGVTR